MPLNAAMSYTGTTRVCVQIIAAVRRTISEEIASRCWRDSLDIWPIDWLIGCWY